MVKGNIYVRMQPSSDDPLSHRSQAAEGQKKRDKLLFDLEMWLNGEIATQAFQKFGVGLRIHIPED
jgi:hypothetical protein